MQDLCKKLNKNNTNSTEYTNTIINLFNLLKLILLNKHDYVIDLSNHLIGLQN